MHPVFLSKDNHPLHFFCVNRTVYNVVINNLIKKKTPTPFPQSPAICQTASIVPCYQKVFVYLSVAFLMGRPVYHFKDRE